MARKKKKANKLDAKSAQIQFSSLGSAQESNEKFQEKRNVKINKSKMLAKSGINEKDRTSEEARLRSEIDSLDQGYSGMTGTILFDIFRKFCRALVLALFLMTFLIALFFFMNFSLTNEQGELHPTLRNDSAVPKPLFDQLTNHFSETERAGQALFKQGFRAHHPVVFVPGIVSTSLEVWLGEKCAMPFRNRIWGSANMMKLMLTDLPCWLRHISLDPVTGLDPPDIQLRSADGLTAADYLVGQLWVWAKIIENLADVGYGPSAIHLAAYDWRLAFEHLELRDQYFSRLKLSIEMLHATNYNRKVAVMAHSMGGCVFTYFMNWVEDIHPGWMELYIVTVAYIGTPFLGAPKTISTILSGEMKDTADLGSFDTVRQMVLSRLQLTDTIRTFMSVPGMFPKGADSVWGKHGEVPPDAYLKAYEARERLGDPLAFSNVADDVCVEMPVKPGIIGVSNADMKALLSANSSGSVTSLDINATSRGDLSSIGMTSTLTLLRTILPQYMARVDELYSLGSENLSTETLQSRHRTWANPLLQPLPNAPSLTIHCMYGVGLDTERGYDFRKNPTRNIQEQLKVPLELNVTHNSVSERTRHGVRFTDGDATVPLVSLGYMCAEGWRNEALGLNPHKVRSVVREYRDPDKTMLTFLLRTDTSVDHVDIMGNSALISDLIRLVAVLPMQQAKTLDSHPKGCNFIEEMAESIMEEVDSLMKMQSNATDDKSQHCWDLPYPMKSSPPSSFSFQPAEVSTMSKVVLLDKIESCLLHVAKRVSEELLS